MNFYSWFRAITYRLEHLTMEQTALLVGAIVVVGLFCLRGFGSRSSY